MPPATVRHPPQTLKQAKRAYQKAGGAPRISAVEQRRLERAAELRERAEGIRKKDKTRKANAKKKVEKEEKEREKRKRMGVPEPVNEGYISPRQVRMGVYLGKRKRDGEEREDTDEIGETSAKKLDLDSARKRSSTTARKPLGERSTNVVQRSQSQRKTPTKQQAICLEEDWAALLDSCSEMEPEEPVQTVTKELHTERKSPQDKFSNVATRSQSQKIIAPQLQFTSTEDEWASMLESNSQIERDISTDIDSPALAPINSKHQPESPSAFQPIVDNAADLLANISTQDILDSGEISPVAPAKLPEACGNVNQERKVTDRGLKHLTADYNQREEAVRTADSWSAVVPAVVSDTGEEERLRLPDDWEPNLLFPSDAEEFELEEDYERPDHQLAKENTDEFDLSRQEQTYLAQVNGRTQPSPPLSPGAPMVSPAFTQGSHEGSIRLDYVLSTQDLLDMDDSIDKADLVPSHGSQSIKSLDAIASFGTDDFELSTQDLRDLGA